MKRLIVDGMSVFKTLAGQAAHLDRGYAFSFLTQVTAAVKKLKPSRVDVCWEGGFTARAQLLPDYKSKRVESSEVQRNERLELQTVLTSLGCHQHFCPGHEADDVIAYLVNTQPGHHVIMSADKDMLQLISPRVSVYQKVRKAGLKAVREVIDIQNFQEKTGWLNPEVYLQAHCALGDSVDQIPKLAGVGEGVIHAYFLGMDIPPSKQKKLDDFFNNSPQYLLNRKLIDLTGVKNLELRTTPPHWSEGDSYRLLGEMGFVSIAERFDTWVVPWYEASGHADISTV